MGRAIFTLALTIAIILVSFQVCSAQVIVPKGDPLVIQVIQLDYADAENLVTVLTPLLSPEGRMVADSRTNSLIIRDRTSVFRKLVEVIKGPIDP